MKTYAFTYHIVNIKPDYDLRQQQAYLQFTYHIVNIKLFPTEDISNYPLYLHIT